MPGELLTKDEAMERLKISKRHLDRLRAQGLLPWVNLAVGPKPLVRFRAEDIAEFERKSLQCGPICQA